MALILVLLLGYLMGSINSAILVCKLFKLPSPRTVGSGNPGATNVLRLGNKWAAGCTLLGDVLKGFLPILIGYSFGLSSPELAWVACAAVLGHIFPLYFGFKGGKGVATGFGALLALHPGLGLLVLATWLIIAFIFKYSSFAALVSTLLAPVYGGLLLGSHVLLPLSILALIIIVRHKDNIERLLSGKESKINESKKEQKPHRSAR